MKYIHGFLSKRLKEENISHDESLVLRYLLNFINSNKMEKILIDGEFYYWVKYEKVVNDLDILGIKKQAISDMLIYDLGEKPSDWEERLSSMKESSRKKKMKSKFLGIFKRYTKKDAEGTKSYFAPTEKLYSLLPNITDNDDDMKNDEIKPNKKAPTAPPVEADNDNFNNNFDTNSIPQNNKKDTKKSKENMETIPKSEVVKIIEKSCVNIKKEDLKDCEEEFTDIDKLKEALTICEINNSHGIKALRMAYKYGENNNNYKPNSFHNCRNRVLDYTKDELDEILKANEKRKKLQREQRELDDKDIDIKDFNIKECAEKSIMDDEYFESLEEGYKIMVIDYINKNKIFKPSWIK